MSLEMEQLAAIMAALEARLIKRPRRPQRQWSTVIQFEFDEGPVLHLVVSGGTAQLVRGSHPQPRTRLRGSLAAAYRVFVAGQDITHPIASGEFERLAGDYFDLILLSRSLGAVAATGAVV